MPLLSPREEFIQDCMKFCANNDSLNSLFTSVKLLKRETVWGIDGEWMIEPIFEVEAEGFEPGDYYVDLYTSVKVITENDTVQTLEHEFSLRKR